MWRAAAGGDGVLVGDRSPDRRGRRVTSLRKVDPGVASVAKCAHFTEKLCNASQILAWRRE